MSNGTDCLDSVKNAEEMTALLCDYAQDPDRPGLNPLRLLMALSGAMVETAFLFDYPDQSLDGLMQKLARRLNVIPASDLLSVDHLPAAYVIDDVTELGRDVARHVLRTFDEAYDFADLVLDVVHHNLLLAETVNIPRAESFRILCEFATRAMVLEVAAQELP